MLIKGKIKKGEYFDSVSLMLVAKEVNKIEGMLDSAVVMGSQENKSILKMADLLIEDFVNSSDTDLLIALKGNSTEAIDNAFIQIEQIFKNLRSKSEESVSFSPKSFEGALKVLPGANVSLISISGKYAAKEAMKALRKGIHVMLFSDNVTIDEELQLKKYAIEKGLLVMGPDCGTAIINGVPLAFSNVVNRGNIGIVAASGTGLQEISSVISNAGAGISQAIGTGGRDVKKEIGGLMFLEGLKALSKDESTKIIVLVSKPPHQEVLQKIADEINMVKKPVVAILIGGDTQILKQSGAIAANTLEEAGLIAATLSKSQNLSQLQDSNKQRLNQINILAEEIFKSIKGKYFRGLYSGGTLCDETQLILKDFIGFVYSNTPLHPDFKLKNIWTSIENTIIDMGDDDFTVGRPHPMIDFSLRNKKIIEESNNPDVAILLLDVVLGYGSNMNPAAELVPSIKMALANAPSLKVICSITGTENDPQNKVFVKNELETAGAIVMSSNAEASLLTGMILKKIGGK